MKRQLGPVIAVLALFCAPLAWSQSGSADSGASTASGSDSGGYGVSSSNPGAAGGATTVGAPTDPYFQVGSGEQSQSGSTDSSQNGSTDSSQSGSSGVSSGSLTDPNGPDDSTNSGPQSTFNHPEQLPPLSMINEVTHNTGVALSLSTGSLSDYVKGYNGQQSYWQNIGMWAGGINFAQIRPTSIVQFGYSGGVNLSSLSVGAYSNYTTLAQSGNARILWNFANRWQVRIKDNYLYTDNPFEPFLTYVSEPTPNQPNPSLYFPAAVIEQNTGSIDLSYRLSAHDSFTMNGSESFQNYIRGTTGLWNSYTWGGGAFYQHVFNPHFSAGAGYNFSALDFGHGQSRSGVSMVEGFLSYKFNSSLLVSGWVGPEYTTTKDLIPVFCSQYGCLIEEQHASQWDVAEGGSVSYNKSGNSIRLQTSHRVTDGGGVLGAINLYQVTLAYARPLSRVWEFSSAIMYLSSVSISHIRANQYWDATQGTINFSRRFGESWNGTVYLLFINQSQNFYGTPGTTSTAGLGVALRYVWGHSLGR